jgi:FtsP/CotA-like multicopper oxidase with cupredoxin domain
MGGSTITDPEELHSKNGVLSVDLTMLSDVAVDGTIEYCFAYHDGTEAPTLVVNPGDLLIFNLANRITVTGATPSPMRHEVSRAARRSQCDGGAMIATATNVHFHGLNVPPRCHGDEVIKTLIQAGDPPFQYRIQIPSNEPPGLYWYHPHAHGFTANQIVGGAAGALIVAGIENIRPEVAGLPQRVLVVRQKSVPNGGDESSVLSVNFVPAFPKLAPNIALDPGERQFWRVANASSIAFLRLAIVGDHGKEKITLIAVDGVPLGAPLDLDTVLIPPAGRAEFIVTGPPLNTGEFVNLGFDTGPSGDPNPSALLANIIPSDNSPLPRMAPATRHDELHRFTNLSSQTPTRQRKLYFSESDDGKQFFITVAGQAPKIYDPYDPPAIVTSQGSIEDWVVENRSTEVHAFHIHQLHFMVLEVNGKPVNDPTIRDTVVTPYWDGQSSRYPSIKLRLDFRDPETVGTFLYHCHILDHEDGGMMAKIKVVPAN